MGDNEQKMDTNVNKKTREIPNVPNLRFIEYNASWQKCSLKSFTKRVTRKNVGQVSKRPLTISAQYGLIDQSEFFDRQIASKDMSGYYLLKKGEFAYNKSYSNDYPWGAVKRLDKYECGALSTLYICFNLDNSIVNSDFISHYFETNKWHKGVSDIAGEGARNHGLLNMSVEDYFLTKHYLPSLIEQEKISYFLNLITARIETQSKIINCLESLLNEISHHYFGSLSSAEIALSKIADIYQPKTISQSECSENGTYNVFGANGIIGKFNQYNHDSPQICITCRGSTSGNVFMTESYSWITGNAMVINIDKNLEIVNKTFLYYYLSSMSFKNIISGSGQPQIVREPLMKIKIKLPSLEEQLRFEKIINSFASKLQKEKDILALYKKQKAYLLANMFI